MLLAIFHMNGQEIDFQDQVQFQYGVAPSLGKHQMETYEYKIKKKTELLGFKSSFQVDYLNSRFTYFEVPEISSTEVYERLHLLNFGFGLVKNLSGQWALSFQFSPRLSSNFSSGLSSEDVILGFGLGVSKRWDTAILYVGLERSTAFGKPQLVPFIHYQQKIGNSLRLQLGFPQSYLEYQIDKRHTLTVDTMAEGNYYNITGNSYFTDFGAISNPKLSFSSFNFSFEHQYKIQPNITTITQIGLLSNNELKVENLDGNPLFAFGTNESVYFSMGLQFNLNKNKND